MSLPMLVNGADCGPINPLQGLSKRLDQDRGVQQDHFGAGRGGSSQEVFRTQYSAAAGVSQDASRFFSASQLPPPLSAPTFDYSTLHSSLPPSHVQAPGRQTPAAAAWAADFLQQPARPASASPLSHGPVARQQEVAAQQEQSLHVQSQYALNGMQPGFVPWSAPMTGYNMGALSPMNAQPFGSAILTPPMSQMHASLLDKAFQSQEASLKSSAEILQQLQESQQQAHTASKSHDASELARTAGLLVETVRHEQSPKFQNSQFLGFMRQVRDGDIVVEGNRVVQREDASGNAVSGDWTKSFQVSADLKGKGRAIDMPSLAGQTMAPTHLAETQSYVGVDSLLVGDVHETALDAYLRQENEDYMRLTGDATFRELLPSSVQSTALGDSSVHGPVGQATEWDTLQRDWDAFEATATGVRPVTNYQFQAHNPYVLGEASRTRHHLAHSEQRSSLYESVLELEAAVQRDRTNALRWYELGVKQQENEREQKALQALQRALELDPTHLPSWLALAISYTNDNNRGGAYNSIREWVERNERYRGAVERFRTVNSDVDVDASQGQRFDSLVRCLIEMARETGGDVDADTQIALAVLLNTNEEYDKARDCFNVALAVRPDDWLLYNRVGATLANSGHPEEALLYYDRALELNPVYIRARFNLGISCVNLRRYDEAAEHILNALILQDGDNVREPSGAQDTGGVTSSALWDSLKTCCLHIQRLDLATLCDRQDLEAFRLNYQL